MDPQFLPQKHADSSAGGFNPALLYQAATGLRCRHKELTGGPTQPSKFETVHAATNNQMAVGKRFLHSSGILSFLDPRAYRITKRRSDSLSQLRPSSSSIMAANCSRRGDEETCHSSGIDRHRKEVAYRGGTDITKSSGKYMHIIYMHMI